MMFGWRIPKSDNTPDGVNKLREALNSVDAVIQENASRSISMTLLKSIGLMICIPVGSIPTIHWRNIGLIGAAIFISTVI